MSATPVVAAIVTPPGSFVGALERELGVELVRIAPETLSDPAERASLVEPAAERLVWIHPVPALAAANPVQFAEAQALLASAAAARNSAAASGAELTFIALLPSQGLYSGPAALSCNLARGAMAALIESSIAEWSAAGHRILAIVHGGLAGHSAAARSPEALIKRTPIGRLGTLGELADAVCYFGSERASYVTGTFLHLDGGWRAYSWIYPARTI
jgi:hypothetical protein